MDHERLVSFLLWCALANYGLLMLSFLASIWMRGPMRRIHQRWFALSDAQIDGLLYAFFGLYKLAIWFFLLVPALVLWATG
jgi:hypothetical protein